MGAAGKGLLFSVLAAGGIPPAATPPSPFGKGGLQRWVLPGGGCHLQVGWNSYFHSSLQPAPSVCPSGSQLPLKRELAEAGAAGKGLFFSVLAAAGIPPAATPPPPFGKGGLRRRVLPGGVCHLQVGWNSYFHSSLRPAPSVCPSGSQLPLKREPVKVGAAGKGLLFSVLAAAGIPPAATPPPPFGKGGLRRWVLPGGVCLPDGSAH